MLLQRLFLEIDFYLKYKLHGEAKLFDDVQSLIFHLVGIANKWSLENMEEKQELPPEIIYAMLLKFQITLPFVLSNKSDVLLEKISYKFKLTDLEKEKLRSLIFNFG